MCIRVFTSDFSHQSLFIDDQMKIHSQILRCPSAQQHAVHENLKILSDFSVPCVNLQLQLDGGVALIDLKSDEVTE